jgi:hypothetical protein
MPILDAQLVYRFSSWLGHTLSMEAPEIQAMRQGIDSLSDLFQRLHAQNQAQSQPLSDATQAPISELFDQFIEQSKARKSSNETAADLNTTQSIRFFLQNDRFPLLHKAFIPLDLFVQRPKTALVTTEALAKGIRAKQQQWARPPSSGQSTLAP